MNTSSIRAYIKRNFPSSYLSPVTTYVGGSKAFYFKLLGLVITISYIHGTWYVEDTEISTPKDIKKAIYDKETIH